MSDGLDPVFKALANADRRRMLDVIRAHPGSTVGDVAARFGLSRVTVMQHLHVLRAAELVVVEPDGRARRLYFNVVPIQMIYDRWTDELSGFFAGRLVQLKRQLEMQEAVDARSTSARHRRSDHGTRRTRVGGAR